MDARFPDRWLMDRRLVRLSDAAFRLYVVSLAWSVSNRTDGILTRDDLDLMPHVKAEAAPELVAAGLWKTTGDSRLIVDFEATQTTAAQVVGIEHKRALDRERKARQRAHERGDHRLCLAGGRCDKAAPSRDVTRDETRDTKARQGQDRQGADGEGWATGPRKLCPRCQTRPCDLDFELCSSCA